MFGFNKKQEYNTQISEDLVSVYLKDASSANRLKDLKIKPKVVIGYAMPNVNLANAASSIKSVLPSDVTLIMASSSGLLCSYRWFIKWQRLKRRWANKIYRTRI